MGIVNRYGCLRGKGSEKSDLLASKFVLCRRVERDHPKDLIMGDEWDSQIRDQAVFAEKLMIPNARISLAIADAYSGFSLKDSVRGAAPAFPFVRFPFFLVNVAAGHRLQKPRLFIP